ncbi:MAG: redoxin domain-containing protein [Planctomycetaceae bacterium]|jgi:thiol-disulfide isomerase/thioredoxin|nr:redoxin domain-containing protein [Planctomycetaceae bacterium]
MAGMNSMSSLVRMVPLTLALCAGLALPAMVVAQDAKDAAPKAAEKAGPTLKVGDKAPDLTVSKWVKGEPVTGFEKGRVYVVEFWATWCGPCKTSIPHLTEVAKKFEKDGVKIIGVSVWERDQSKVAPFVEQMGDKMNYHVAMDDVPEGGKGNDGKMAKGWMTAAGQNGIPSAFIVGKQGTIEWIGHPMDGMDKVLGKVIDGTFDAKAEAERKAKEQEQQQKLNAAMRGGNFDEAFAMMDEAVKADPSLAPRYAMIKFQTLLMRKKDEAAAYAHGAKIVDNEIKGESQMLNGMAWMIVDGPGIKDRDLDLALKAAGKANELTGNKDAQILDTLAKVHFLKGDAAKAVEIQELAIKSNTEKEMEADLKKALDEYQAAKDGKK